MNDESSINYDLIKRTTEFSKKAIQLAKKVKLNQISSPIINQFIRSSTSMGANYCEANNAESKKDFHHKIGICKKESVETDYWLNLLFEYCPKLTEEIALLQKECHEFTLIFGAINKKNKFK